MDKKCYEIYKWMRNLRRYSFPFDKERMPKNGIYILFEKGEIFEKDDRVVRVGTHTGFNKLPSRLNEHFLRENKDRSIFRKNIGRAILNKEKNDFLKYWDIDLTTKDAREKYEHKVNFELKDETEMRVSDYIQKNFSFVVFELDNKDSRLHFEKKLISTFSLCAESNPSINWLGNHSPKTKIRDSGLWQVNQLWKDRLTDDEFIELETFIKK